CRQPPALLAAAAGVVPHGGAHRSLPAQLRSRQWQTGGAAVWRQRRRRAARRSAAPVQTARRPARPMPGTDEPETLIAVRIPRSPTFRMPAMQWLFIVFQYLVPQHLLSRLVGKIAASELPWIKNPFIDWFSRRYQVDMSEAADPEPRNYPSFNAFFTRALKAGARPLDSDPDSIVSPADGAISQLGAIEAGRIFQAKGQTYTTAELLGDTDMAALFDGGVFATVYLSPRDYHRVHMPVSGRLLRTLYVPGDLFSVNQTTAENVPRLFARNERLVCLFDTECGPMAVVLVGAMIVAGIDTVWAGQVAPPL